MPHLAQKIGLVVMSLGIMALATCRIPEREPPQVGVRPSQPSPGTAPAKSTKSTQTSSHGSPPAFQSLRLELATRFDAWLEDPAEYATRARRECRHYPEGDLFPFTLPAMAYAQLAFADSAQSENALSRMGPLLEQAIISTRSKVRPPGGELVRLDTTKGHGVYLGQLNLALAHWHLAGGDDRFLELHRHLSRLLAKQLQDRSGRPIKSFPGYSWTFDTVPAIASVVAFERHSGQALGGRRLITDHLTWVDTVGTEPRTKLPYSRLTPLGRGLTDPRGCELSWRISLLAQLDPARARRMYERYTEVFWLERSGFAGFAEWPHGRQGRSDLDSGPIHFGIGAAATTLGISTLISMDDRPRLRQLEQEVEIVQMALESGLLEQLLPEAFGFDSNDSRYSSGFLFGDATLFYTTTWSAWPET